MKPFPIAVALLWIIGALAASPAWSQWPGRENRGGADKAPSAPGFGGPSRRGYDIRDNKSDGGGTYSDTQGGNSRRSGPAANDGRSGRTNPAPAGKAPGQNDPGADPGSHPGRRGYDLRNNKKM